MKRISALIIAVMFLFLSGCSFKSKLNLQNKNVESLKGWIFQYSEATNTYGLFFGFLDGSGKYISADADVDIRIVNDADEEVYRAHKSVTKRDFAEFSSEALGEHYLAKITILPEEITAGKSADGKVYLSVYKDGDFAFDEVNCTAFNCLPIAEVSVVGENLNTAISVKDYSGKVVSELKIEEVTYTFDKLISAINISVSGTKISGDKNNTYDNISYKVYNSGGFVVDSSSIYVNNISAGDKFKYDSIWVYHAVPGETYKIVFEEYKP